MLSWRQGGTEFIRYRTRRITRPASSRSSGAVTAPLLLLLGSILAIHLRHSTPLAVYLVAFLPAIADILLISGGEQTLRRGPSFLGYGLLWSGNLLLIVFCVAAWLRLRRH